MTPNTIKPGRERERVGSSFCSIRHYLRRDIEPFWANISKPSAPQPPFFDPGLPKFPPVRS
jgi:hypothetical protein